MEMVVWISILSSALSNLLKSTGQTEAGELLAEATAAYRAGKNVDPILRELAGRWQDEGEPKIETITDTRKKIQALYD